MLFPDFSSLENKEVTSNIARTSSHTEVIENGTIQHSTPKAMKHSNRKKDTSQHSPKNKNVGKKSPKNNVINNSPKDKTLNKKTKKQKGKIELDNSQSENISGVCFTLRFENTKTLQTHTGNKPDSSYTPNGLFSFLGQSPNNEKHVRMAYTCDYCQESFKFKHRLEEHVLTHEEKLYFCIYCNSSFNQQHLLKLHEKSHSKHYACEEYLEKFQRLIHLKQHLSTHSIQKSYHCEHCQKSFKQISKLQQHLRKHIVEKPYTCYTCYKSFKHKNHLLQHNKVHILHVSNLF